MAFLNKDLFFLEFSDPEEARWVLDVGRRSFKGEMLQLDWWSPYIDCVKRKELVKEAWLRVVRLPLHLWTPMILKMIGDSCRGFLALDKDTTLKTKILWARVLVRLEGKERPSMVNILAGMQSFGLQGWWELPSWSADVYPSKGDCKMVNQKWEKREEEDEGLTHASQSMWRLQGKGHHVGHNCRFEGTTEQGDRVRALAAGKEVGFGSLRSWQISLGEPVGFTKSIHLGGPEQQLKPMASRPRSPTALSGEGLRFGPREGLLEKDEGSKGLISPEVPQLGHCINLVVVESVEGREVDDNPKVMASPRSRGEVKMREESMERYVPTAAPSYSASFLDQAFIPERPFGQGGSYRHNSIERDAFSSQPLRVVMPTEGDCSPE